MNNEDLVLRLRSDTPGCENVVHFNNAGAALMTYNVYNAVERYQNEELFNGGYEAQSSNSSKLEDFYIRFAQLLNCSSEEIAYCESATRAWDMAFYSIAFKKGDRILTSRCEYASNFIAYMQVARKTGVVVEVVPNDASGQVDVARLEEMMDSSVKLISITHVPTNGGLVNPAAQVGAIAKKYGVLYLLDACQSVGQMPIDVEAIGCDMLSATGRKYLRGPRGTGVLYVNKDIISQLEPPFLDLLSAQWTDTNEYTIRPDARRFENWERNVSGMIGLSEAVKYLLDLDINWVQERISSLACLLRQNLRDIPGISIMDLGVNQCGIVTFCAQGMEPSQVVRGLRNRGINASFSIKQDTLLDMSDRAQESWVRLSVHYYNTESEVNQVAQEIKNMVNKKKSLTSPSIS